MTISKALLDILVCPKCRGRLDSIEKEGGLLCITCGLFYSIRADIPVMLVDRAIESDKGAPQAPNHSPALSRL